ncbi:MAG: non-canonical purine NTP pyrophosphatase [Bacteroidetes bacterium]|nr:non-canonical purine NTP pyrophosphatase [Bacteroidota bacterium]
MEIVFATANKNKIKEIQALIPTTIKVLGLTDINCTEVIPETQATIEGNASQKAFYVYNNYHVNCFADDTGLEVEALEGRPGVLSARYAGESKNADDNMNKILEEMQGVTNRKARFKTVISLVIDGKEIQFEGIINGTMLTEKQGAEGFGYDPIFAPDLSLNHSPIGNGQEAAGETGSDIKRKISFAEMDLSEKNKISHRALAVNKLVEYLNRLD